MSFHLSIQCGGQKSKKKILLNFSQRIPKHQWWLKLRPLLRILAKHDSTYEEEGMYITVEEEMKTDSAIL